MSLFVSQLCLDLFIELFSEFPPNQLPFNVRFGHLVSIDFIKIASGL